MLVGSFQRERFYREAEPRWREFARTAELALALADFEKPAAPEGAPFEVPIGRDHPLAQRVGDRLRRARASPRASPGASARRTGERVFEMLWSVEPEVVREAVRIGLDLATRACRSWPSGCPSACRGRPTADRGAVARATSVTNRMLAYVPPPSGARAELRSVPRSASASGSARAPCLDEAAGVLEVVGAPDGQRGRDPSRRRGRRRVNSPSSSEPRTTGSP